VGIKDGEYFGGRSREGGSFLRSFPALLTSLNIALEQVLYICQNKTKKILFGISFLKVVK
jgi:hypothetical protein